MQKIYTGDVLTSNKTKSSPSKETLNNILAFSKSLEVLKSKKTKVELNLN
ncbi:MAG: hypothetical protein ACI857_000495 [Arenicella sp.]|jgi:hypothetical protein